MLVAQIQSTDQLKVHLLGDLSFNHLLVHCHGLDSASNKEPHFCSLIPVGENRTNDLRGETRAHSAIMVTGKIQT